MFGDLFILLSGIALRELRAPCKLETDITSKFLRSDRFRFLEVDRDQASAHLVLCTVQRQCCGIVLEVFGFCSMGPLSKPFCNSQHLSTCARHF